MGVVFSRVFASMTDPPSVILVPPFFDTRERGRSRFAKSSYDRVFSQPHIRALFQEYQSQTTTGIIRFSPPEDPRINATVKLLIPCSIATTTPSKESYPSHSTPSSSSPTGSITFRYQPDPNTPYTFFDIKAKAGIDSTSNATLRACYFHPKTNTALFGMLPLMESPTQQHPSSSPINNQTNSTPLDNLRIGLRYSSPVLSSGFILQPFKGILDSAWLVGRTGSFLWGVQANVNAPWGDYFASINNVLHERGILHHPRWSSRCGRVGRVAGATTMNTTTSMGNNNDDTNNDDDTMSGRSNEWDMASMTTTPTTTITNIDDEYTGTIEPVMPTSSSSSLSNILLHKNTSWAIAYQPQGQSAYNKGIFSAVLEVQQQRNLVLSFLHHMAVQRNVRNPFEKSDVIGITNYIDIAVQMITDISGSSGGHSSGGHSNTNNTTNSSNMLRLGVSWQANKNVLVKGRVGFDGVGISTVFKSWVQPSFTCGLSLSKDFTATRSPFKLGMTIAIENYKHLRYERSSTESKMSGGRVTQRHVASDDDIALHRGIGVLVPLDEVNNEEVLGQRQEAWAEYL